MKKIFVVYRENDLYKKLVPKIMGWLKDLEVEMITFFSTANVDEIRIGMNKHLAKFRNNLVISDKTCVRIICDEDEKANPTQYTSGSFKGKKENPIFFTDTLDSLCDKAVRITCGAMFKKGYTNIINDDMVGTEIIVSNLIEKIKNHGVAPEKIYVVSECTGDHSPFHYREHGINGDYDSDIKRKYEKDVVAPVIAQWFAKKFENKVEIVSALRNKEVNLIALKTINTPKTWVIMDRHFSGSMMKHSGLDRESFFNQATVLRLPISDFFEDVYRHKLLEAADELFTNEECLKRLIEEEVKED